MAMVFCRGCGKEIHETATTCPHCGAKQKIEHGRSKTTATVLTFFLGGFGAHKFYLGKTGLGILYLLFFWTFIPAFVAFVEFFMLLSMSEDKFNTKFNQS